MATPTAGDDLVETLIAVDAGIDWPPMAPICAALGQDPVAKDGK